jgi:hypothetical protein
LIGVREAPLNAELKNHEEETKNKISMAKDKLSPIDIGVNASLTKPEEVVTPTSKMENVHAIPKMASTKNLSQKLTSLRPVTKRTRNASESGGGTKLTEKGQNNSDSPSST